jgi:hypothetical protein
MIERHAGNDISRMIASVHEMETYDEGLRTVEAHFGIENYSIAVDFKKAHAGQWLPSARRIIRGEKPSEQIMMAVESLSMFIINSGGTVT